MKVSSSDRNLLLGMIALQMDFVTRDELIAAMQAWTLEKSRSLSDILLERGILERDDKSLIESLVNRHMTRHGNDLDESLSSLAKPNLVTSSLETIDDPEIQATLSRLNLPRTEEMHAAEASVTAPYPSPGERVASRYRIIRLHDEGGIGSVYVAVDSEVNRQVALKQLKAGNSSTEQDRLRFIQEAEITGNLEHPGIVPVYGKGEYSDGRPYYAMRFIRGKNLKAAILALHAEGKETLNPGEWRREFQGLLRRFLVVCETVAYAHERGVIHRDLKPQNILLGPHGETLVVDWGLAKIVGRRDPDLTPEDMTVRPPSSSDLDPTAAGSQIGTPAFMSPEQAVGEVEQLTFATDIYSLGATLYMLLTGRAPFLGSDRAIVAAMVRTGEFPAPRQIKPSLDLAINSICLKAMALTPENRYPTPRALAEDLERWMADQPVIALPKEPFTTRRNRWIRQNRSLISSAAVILVLSVVGLSIFAWVLSGQISVARQAEAEKTEQAKVAQRAEADKAEQVVKMRGYLEQVLLVSNEALANIPEAEELRMKLAKMVLDGHLELAEKFPNDPDIDLELARVCQTVAAIKRMTGKFEESKEIINRAIHICNKYKDDPKRGTNALSWLTQAYIDRGEVHSMSGITDKAIDDQKVALHLSEIMRDRGIERYWYRMGSALINSSEMFLLIGEQQEAHQCADRAITLFTEPLKESKMPDPIDAFHYLFAMALTDRGRAHLAAKSTKPAVKDFRRAADEARKIPSDSDFGTSGSLQMAAAMRGLADALAPDQKARVEAANCLKESIKSLQDAAKASKDYTAYREELALCYASRCRIRLLENRLDEAAADNAKAREYLAKPLESAPDNPNFLSELATLVANDIEWGIRKGPEMKPRIAAWIKQETDLLKKALTVNRKRAADRQRVLQLEELASTYCR